MNSNSNISKKNKHMKTSNKNNFNKSSKFKKYNNISKINFNNNNFFNINTNNNIYNSIDFAITKTSTNKGNHQLHLPYKDIIKSSIISNKNEIKNKSKKYTLKISNSNKFLSFNGISSKKIYSSSRKKSHNNIRLNLNNEFINKNFPTENNRKINKGKNSNLFYAEKLKEKNNKINKLKKDLILSEIILNELKKKDDKSELINDKNFDSIFYEYNNSNSNNTITKINFDRNKKMLTLNFNNDNFNNRKGSSLINIGSLLTFNYINNNNISYNNTFKKSLSPDNKTIYKNNNFFSLTNSNLYNNASLSSKNENKNKSKIIYIRKSGPFYERNIDKKEKEKNDFALFIEKCNNLKKRTTNILNKYIKLSESISKSYNNK